MNFWRRLTGCQAAHGLCIFRMRHGKETAEEPLIWPTGENYLPPLWWEPPLLLWEGLLLPPIPPPLPGLLLLLLLLLPVRPVGSVQANSASDSDKKSIVARRISMIALIMPILIRCTLLPMGIRYFLSTGIRLPVTTFLMNACTTVCSLAANCDWQIFALWRGNVVHLFGLAATNVAVNNSQASWVYALSMRWTLNLGWDEQSRHR